MKSPRDIRWDLVSAASSHYHRWGYEYIETPWIVSQKAVEITLPPGKFGYYLGHPNYSPGFLVGSAEQAFIQLMLADQLGPGKYYAIGPCFRDDPIDELHKNSFFKVELIEIEGRTQVLDDGSVYRLMSTAKRFFEDECHQETRVMPIPNEPGAYDLELNGIEIGSYGLRKFEKHRWVYGTGLALPRFTQAAEKNNNNPIWDPR